MFSFLKVHSQCTTPCSLTVTNKIDCDVELEFFLTCNGVPVRVIVAITPGTSSNPTVTTPLSAGIYCNCTVTGVRVNKINGLVPTGGFVWLGSSTTTINMLGTCCPVNYGTFSGCNVDLWMSCP